MHSTSFVSLRGDDVAVLLDLTDSRLPALLHWGADLGDLSEADARALRAAAVPPVAPNQPDVPLRLAILPEHHTGWTGRPGISGSRAGRGWSPRFTVTEVMLDGEPVVAPSLFFNEASNAAWKQFAFGDTPRSRCMDLLAMMVSRLTK